ncbi:hypothetical protein V8E51_010914 [Hyaloscypha variabilis]
MDPRILLVKHPLPTSRHLPRPTASTLLHRASIGPHLVCAQPLQHLSLQPLLEPEVPDQQSGQIPSVPWIPFSVTPSSIWQTSDLGWDFEYNQPDFQLMILFSCENMSPIWIDAVGANIEGQPNNWNTVSCINLSFSR